MSVDDFLADSGWSGAAKFPLAGDASARRYVRLRTDSDASAVLMIAPEFQADSTRSFVKIAQYLSENGFSAPAILKADIKAGLVLLEDLGDQVFSRCIALEPTRETALYSAAIDCLVALQARRPPEGLVAFDARMMAEATELAQTQYAGHDVPHGDLTEALGGALETVPDLTTVMVHRDYHSENLLWLKGRASHSRVGLIDFQDALLGHPAYDLVSLLQDARRELGKGLEAAMLERYLSHVGFDRERFGHHFALIGVQRHLRILGVFARLAKEDGKTGYLTYVPRTWAHLVRCLEHPGLGDLRDVLLARIPPPSDAAIDLIDA